MSDYSKAQVLIALLNPKGYDELKLLDDLLGKNQNPPPDGEADGSFSTEQWYALRTIITALKDIQGAVKHFAYSVCRDCYRVPCTCGTKS